MRADIKHIYTNPPLPSFLPLQLQKHSHPPLTHIYTFTLTVNLTLNTVTKIRPRAHTVTGLVTAVTFTPELTQPTIYWHIIVRARAHTHTQREREREKKERERSKKEKEEEEDIYIYKHCKHAYGNSFFHYCVYNSTPPRIVSLSISYMLAGCLCTRGGRASLFTGNTL